MILKKFEWEDSKRWDAFCKKNGLAWFWHTSFRMKHALNCSFTIKSENHSFYIEENGKIIAIAPITIDKYTDNIDGAESERKEMSYGGGMVPFPVVEQRLKNKRKDKLYKLIFEEIDRIAMANNVSRIIMKNAMTLSYCKKNFYYNILMKYGFQDISLNTVVLDIEKSESDLWDEIMSRHKWSINKAKKFLKIKLFDKNNISKEIFESFKSDYFKIAGKVTHPEKVFQLLYHYLTNNMAVMGQALYNNIPVGYVITIYYKNDAYYLMGVSETGFNVCPVAHLILWEMLTYLKHKGIENFELGHQHFGPNIHNRPSKKEISISYFKKGFGGVTIPLFVGEKIYTKDRFIEIWNNRIESCINNGFIGDI